MTKNSYRNSDYSVQLCKLLSVTLAVLFSIGLHGEEALPQKVDVELEPYQVKGSAIDNYILEEVESVGPWGDMSLRDTPYTINVITSDLIENVQAFTVEDAFKYSPYANVYISSSRFASNVNLRGYYNNVRMVDGIRLYGSVSNQTLDDKETVQILVGATSFMYGMTGASGAVNYITKRPTLKPYASFTLGNTGGLGGGHLHLDLGGPLVDQVKLGYRLNVVEQDGSTFLEEQDVHRELYSGAVDRHVNDKLYLVFDASYSYTMAKGMQISFSSSTMDYSELDPDDVDMSELWGQKWGLQRDVYKQIGVQAELDLSDNLSVRSALRFNDSLSERLNINSSGITTFDETYSERLYHIGPAKYSGLAGYAYIDFQFKTWGLDHKITTGAYFEDVDGKAPAVRTAITTIPGVFNFDTPIYVDKPDYEIGTDPNRDYRKYSNANFMIGDEISIGDSWVVLGGISHSVIDQKNYNTITEELTSEYDKSKTTPTASVIYKPLNNVSIYATYMEAMNQGGTAPDTYNDHEVTNAGEVMKPMISEQKELGVKATLNKMFLTLTAFRLDQANQYTDPDTYTYVQDGLVVYKGVEFTASGKIMDGLNIVSGYTYTHAETIHNKVNPSLEGKRPNAMAEKIGKIYLEYDLPFLKGFTATGGVFYTGDIMMDSANTDRIDSVTTCDLGFRFSTNIVNRETVFRFNISNLTDKRYWMQYGYMGDPRAYTFSAQVRF